MTRDIEPLAQSEQDAIIETAKSMGDILMHKKKINVYAVVVFFLDTGAHPCVLAQKETRELKITMDGADALISWYRPKKKGKDAFTQLPVSARLKPIIKDFLASELPTYRSFFNDVLEAVRDEVRKTHPEPWTRNICPMGFRHTFGVNRIDEGFSETKVAQFMNCSPKTLRTYVRYSKKRLVEKGW
jgi:hypothetical protein